MTDTIDRRWIKPSADIRVLKPDGTPLDSAGEEVVWSLYWARRELDGDIVPTSADEAASAARRAAADAKKAAATPAAPAAPQGDVA